MDSSFNALFARLNELSEQFNELREGIQKAVAVADLDPEMALTRTRKVLEYVVRDVYERHIKQPAGTQPLENLLQRLSKDGHIPTRVEAYATGVRKLGNVGTHAFGEKITTTDVSHSLGQLLAIVEWYFETERPDALARPTPAAEPAARKQEPHAAQTSPVIVVKVQPAPASPQPVSSKRGVIAAVVAAAVLLLALVGLWAGGVFKSRPASAPLAANLDEPPGKGATATAADDSSAATRSAPVPATQPTSTNVPPATASSVGGKGSGHWATLGPMRTMGRPAPASSGGTKAAQPSPDTTGDFVPLFNGKDLTGWRPHPIGKAHWEVKDGVLIGSGARGHLFTDGRTYENFRLRVEAKINDGGNSGVYFRAPFGPASLQGFPTDAYEAQINSTHSDPFKTGSLFAGNKPAVTLKPTPIKPDDWFRMEIIADGSHIIIKVNGETTTNYVDPAPRSRVGQFALQVHDAGTIAEFRKIEVKELPGGE